MQRSSHHSSVPYRTQMNGAVEEANKNIKNITQKITVTYKDWHGKLPYALFAYRITAKVSNEATSYSLVYGTEAEWVKTRYDQLNLTEKKWLPALCHGQTYQQRISGEYHEKVKYLQIQEGNLVVVPDPGALIMKDFMHG
jgi:hypothetical protein